MSHHTDWLPAILINNGFRVYLHRANMNENSKKSFHQHMYTDQILTVVSVDSSSRRLQPCAAASLCFGRVPGCSPARETDASPAQPARAPTQTPVNKQ